MKSYTVWWCCCACLKLGKATSTRGAFRCKSSNKGVGFLKDGGRKDGDFHRSKDGGRREEGGEKKNRSMKQGGMRGK